MIYEQRIYSCIPGKLPALLSRFENHTLKIWEKHGIKQAGFALPEFVEMNNSLSSPEGGEGRGEEANHFENQIPSPQPSPRSGGERELMVLSGCAWQT